jgi:AraC-like DNA-binding protein
MPYWDFARPPVGARGFMEAGEAHGVPAERSLHGTGLTAAQLADPATRVEAGQELQVARNLIEQLGDRAGLGVEAGRRMTIGDLGIWGFAVLTSPTWGEALLLGLRFAQLTSTFMRPQLGGSAGALALELHDEEVPADVRDIVAERDLAAVAVLVPLIAGRMPPVRIVTRLDRARTAALAELVGGDAQVSRGGETHSLSADLGLLTTPLPQANADTRRACELECQRLLDAQRTRTGTAGRVRARLLERPERMPAMSTVAQELHVDVRTLRRHLAEEDTTFRALRDEVRATLAAELLRTVGLSVAEVAARLGYSDPVAFTHAFTRWKGTPPSAFR